MTNPCLDRYPSSTEIILLDLETTGVSVTEDRIVELAAVQMLPNHMIGHTFSTSVFVDIDILTSRGQDAAHVHGIEQEEITISPTFPVAWRSFLQFIESLSNYHIQESTSDSEDESREVPMISDEYPGIVIGAHNGIKFDFAMLLFECYRHNLDMSVFEHWVFVDTIHITAAAKDIIGPCLKLQCLAGNVCGVDELRAHRARDDCVALCRVVMYMAFKLGISFRRLMVAFAVRVDVPTSLKQVSAMA